MEWIKCSERMPEDGVSVLAWHIEGYPCLVVWEENRDPLYVSECGNYSRLSDRWHHASTPEEFEPDGSFTHWAAFDWNETKKLKPGSQNDNEMFAVIEGGDFVFAWWDSVKDSFLDNHDLCIRRYMNPTHWMSIPKPPSE